MNQEELIEKYIQNNLDSKEKKEFNYLLNTNDDFKKEVAFHDNLKIITEKEDSEKIKNRLQNFEPKKATLKISTKWLAAASVILLICVSAFVFSLKPSNQNLFAENFEPYRNVAQPVVRGEQNDDIKSKAFVAYEMEDFKNALLYFSELQKSPSESYASFYAANSQLALGNSKEAILAFQSYLKQNNLLLKDKTHWYLALSYINENSISQAKKILSEIIKEEKYNHQKASVLLKKLK